jgi:hypothetical protein
LFIQARPDTSISQYFKSDACAHVVKDPRVCNECDVHEVSVWYAGVAAYDTFNGTSKSLATRHSKDGIDNPQWYIKITRNKALQGWHASRRPCMKFRQIGPHTESQRQIGIPRHASNIQLPFPAYKRFHGCSSVPLLCLTSSAVKYPMGTIMPFRQRQLSVISLA